MNTFTKTLLFATITAAACIASWLALRPGAPAQTARLGRSFQFDANGTAHTPVDFPQYTESTTINIKDQNVTAITVGDDDRIVLCNPDGLTILNAEGTTLQLIPLPFPPFCTAVSTNGTFYVGTEGRVAVLAPDGTLQETLLLPQSDARPSCVMIHGQHLFIADAQNGNLIQMDRSGHLVRTISNFTLFSSPGFDVALDHEGFIWANNPGERALRKYRTDGQLVTSWTRPGRDITGFSGCCNPTDIAMLKDGTIVTSEKHILRIKVLDPQGRVKAVVAGPEAFDSELLRVDIATDSLGRVLVLDSARQQLRIFERQQQDHNNELEN